MSFYHVLQFCMLLVLGWVLLGAAVTKPGLQAELIYCRDTVAALPVWKVKRCCGGRMWHDNSSAPDLKKDFFLLTENECRQIFLSCWQPPVWFCRRCVHRPGGFLPSSPGSRKARWWTNLCRVHSFGPWVRGMKALTPFVSQGCPEAGRAARPGESRCSSFPERGIRTVREAGSQGSLLRAKMGLFLSASADDLTVTGRGRPCALHSWWSENKCFPIAEGIRSAAQVIDKPGI